MSAEENGKDFVRHQDAHAVYMYACVWRLRLKHANESEMESKFEQQKQQSNLSKTFKWIE